MEDAVVCYNPEEPAPSSPIALAKQKHEAALMQIDGVEGVAIGKDALGNDAIIVYLREASVKPRVPRQLDGFPVETEVTGLIDAQRR